MSQFDYTPLIGYAVSLIITGVVLAYHRFYAAQPKDKQKVIGDLASVVVPSVEQSMGLLAGPAKKQAAVSMIEELAGAFGVKGIPASFIDAAIEAAVYSLNQNTMTASTQRIPVVGK